MSIWARTFHKNEDEKKILIVCLVNIYVSIEILFKQPKRGVNWVIKIYAKQTTQQFKSNALIRTKIINLIKQDNKRVREEKSNTWFYVVLLIVPTSVPPSSPSLRIPLNKSPRLQPLLQLTSKVSINLYNKRLSSIS